MPGPKHGIRDRFVGWLRISQLRLYETSPQECQKLANRGLKLLQELKRLTLQSDHVDFAEWLDFKSISFLLAGRDELKVADRQRLLEMTSVHDRLAAAIGMLEEIVAQINQAEQVRKVIGGNGGFRH
jgi:hypothetical protein